MKVLSQSIYQKTIVDSHNEFDVSHKQTILDLIRDGRPERKKERKNNGATRKNASGSSYEQSPHVSAVRYVRNERMKEGLSAESKEELENIEEESLRQELSSSRKMDAKDKIHAVQCKTIEEYLDTKTFTRKIADEMWAKKVAQELVEWVNKPRDDGRDKIHLGEFFIEKGIYHRDFHRLSKRYEVLAQAADYAIKVLGCIRERNILENKWNPTAGMFMMGHYNEDWAAEMRRREEAKQKQNITNTIDLAGIVRDTIRPVAPTEEVRLKIEQDSKRS